MSRERILYRIRSQPDFIREGWEVEWDGDYVKIATSFWSRYGTWYPGSDIELLRGEFVRKPRQGKLSR